MGSARMELANGHDYEEQISGKKVLETTPVHSVSHKVYGNYKVGDTSRGGYKIVDIRGGAENVIAFKADNGTFRFECAPELDAKCITIMTEYHYFLSYIKAS